jgi:hypothetical protein
LRKYFLCIDLRNLIPSAANTSALGAICLHIAVLAAVFQIEGLSVLTLRSEKHAIQLSEK